MGSALVGIRTRVSASKGLNDWPLHYQSLIAPIANRVKKFFIEIMHGPPVLKDAILSEFRYPAGNRHRAENFDICRSYDPSLLPLKSCPA